LNLNNKYLKGFSLIEVLVGILLSSGVLISLTYLMGNIFNQLSYEDVNQKITSYGNYVLDDIAESFKEPDIDKIRIDNYDGYSIIRVEFDDNSADIKYSHNLLEGIMKDNEPIHENNNTVDQYFNDFENSNYSIVISEFKCNELGYAGNTDKYGNRPFDGSEFKNAFYVVDMQIEIYKDIKNMLEFYNVVDFQRTIFVSDEFI